MTLQCLIGVKLGWFPVLASPRRAPSFLTAAQLPHAAGAGLVVVYFGYIARMTRAGTIQALDADYTRTADDEGPVDRRR